MSLLLIRSGTKEIYDISRRDSSLFKAMDKLVGKGTDYIKID